MKTSIPAGIATVLLLFLGSRTVAAQQTALSTSGSPSLIISTGTAGSDLASVTSGAAYRVSVKNGAGVKKITAQLDQLMPANTSLQATLSAPVGATSAGAITLDTTPRDMVTNLFSLSNVNGTITYRFSATVLAGVINSSRTVTYTVINFP